MPALHPPSGFPVRILVSSLGTRHSSQWSCRLPPVPRNASQPPRREINSLPFASMNQPPRSEFNQAYGSLSSFHQQGANPIGASPLSALRSAVEIADRASPTGSPIERPTTGFRSMHGSKASLSSVDGGGPQHRSSVSFMQLFRSSSLSALLASNQVASSPRASSNRMPTPMAPLHQEWPSLRAMPPSSNKVPPPSFEHASTQNAILTSNTGSSPLPVSQHSTKTSTRFPKNHPLLTARNTHPTFKFCPCTNNTTYRATTLPMLPGYRSYVAFHTVSFVGDDSVTPESRSGIPYPWPALNVLYCQLIPL